MNNYKSCNLLEHGICFYPKNVCSCCYAPYEQDELVPLICSAALYNGENIEKDYLFNKINKWREDAKNNKFIKSCNECYHLKSAAWTDENYIDQIYITHFEECNSNCIYCINNLDNGKRKTSTYKIVPIIDNMIEQGIIKKGCEFMSIKKSVLETIGKTPLIEIERYKAAKKINNKRGIRPGRRAVCTGWG